MSSSPGRTLRAAPVDVLHLPSPSPEEILSTLPVKPRTYNSLRRFVAGRASDGTWSFGRLLEIPGFGTRALHDVLEALDVRTRWPTAAAAGEHRFLEDEIDEVLSARPSRRPAMPTPLLRRALTLVGSRLPAAEADIAHRLAATGLARGLVDLGRIERASRFVDTQVSFLVLRREGLTLAVQPERQRMAALIYALAVRSVVNFGLALVRRVGFLARTDDQGFVKAVLSAKDTFQWLDRRLGWFWFRSPRAQLVRTIEKILGVAGTVTLKDLAHVLFRRWSPDNAPSLRALRALCAEVETLSVEGGAVRLRSPQAAALSERDQNVLQLFEAWGPRIEGHRLHEICHRMGVPAGTLGRQLRASPLVVEPRPGVFRLVGT